MGKRLKLRIYRVIATTLQSCRSKDPSNLPKDPVPSFPSLSKFSAVHFPHPPALNHHVSSAFISTHPPQFKWQKEEQWHAMHHPRHNSDSDDLVFAQPTPPSPPPPEKNRRRAKKKRNIPTRIRLSTSSADSGWFSSEGGGGASASAAPDEETETLVSSSPGSSSELHPIRETQAFTTNLPQRRSRRSKSSSKRTKRGGVRAAAEGDTETPARLSMFKKLIPCTVEGKVKESFAIVKRSEDPYEDFKSSMMDMIVEKQMFEQKDLEQLLQCFLSLNSRKYHGIIVQAFSEIWEAIFSPAKSNSVRRY